MNNFLLDRCKNGHQITQSQDKLEMQEKEKQWLKLWKRVVQVRKTGQRNFENETG